MNSNLIIRLAHETDADVMAELTNALGYQANASGIGERLNELLKSPDHLVLVAETDKQICAWLQAHSYVALESGFQVEIVGLVVAANRRRQGVGKLLVQHAERWAARLKAKTMVVRSNITRAESHAFYPALGYFESKTQTVYQKFIE